MDRFQTPIQIQTAEIAPLVIKKEVSGGALSKIKKTTPKVGVPTAVRARCVGTELNDFGYQDLENFYITTTMLI